VWTFALDWGGIRRTHLEAMYMVGVDSVCFAFGGS